MLCADGADEQTGTTSKMHRQYLGATIGATSKDQ